MQVTIGTRWLQLTTIMLCLLSAVVLHSSSSHYGPMLRHYILQQEYHESYQGLWPAAKEGSVVALDALAHLASLQNDIYWLEQAASLQNLHAQLALAELLQGTDKVFWLQQAAINGHAASQFELSLLADSKEERVRYLEQAALNEYSPAIIALSRFYYENRDIDNALRWLKRAAEFDESSNFMLARMFWRKDLKTQAKAAFEKAALATPIAQQYVNVLSSYPPSLLSDLARKAQPFPPKCSQYLQFVATSLDTAVQAANIKSAFEEDARLQALPICIGSILWLAPNQLTCDLVDNRSECDLSRIAKKSFTPGYTHLVFFLEEGKAYVHNGAMYLDQADTYSVFVHELAHFVGFVDEYAVSTSLAQQYCYKSDAPNLLVHNDTDLYQHSVFQRWQVYHRELSVPTLSSNDQQPRSASALEISASRTCAALNVQSYKPSTELTFMEYHDAHTIPPIYLLMWQDLLKQQHQHVAVSSLFALQAQRAGQNAHALYWQNFP